MKRRPVIMVVDDEPLHQDVLLARAKEQHERTTDGAGLRERQQDYRGGKARDDVRPGRAAALQDGAIDMSNYPSSVLSNQGGWVEPPAKLTITDIERLAKAGVTVTFADIAAQVTPDYMPASPVSPEPEPTTLEDAFWQRWRRAHIAKPFDGGRMAPYQIHAHECDGKVFVMVCPQTEDPFLIEDEAALYPSDALMAKLAIYEKVKP